MNKLFIHIIFIQFSVIHLIIMKYMYLIYIDTIYNKDYYIGILKIKLNSIIFGFYMCIVILDFCKISYEQINVDHFLVSFGIVYYYTNTYLYRLVSY